MATVATSHKSQVEQLVAILGDRKADGQLANSAVAAAKTLAEMRAVEVVGFLADNFTYAEVEPARIGSGDPDLLDHPFLNLLVVNYRIAGAQAIIGRCGWRNRAMSDAEIELAARGILAIFGPTAEDKAAALSLVTWRESKRPVYPDRLKKLREEVARATVGKRR
jgi:hypothetical protein